MDIFVLYISAVDEQNAQTVEQSRLLRGASGSSGDLVQPFNSAQYSLQAGSPNSRSAPSFSVFTSDVAPKSPPLLARKLGMLQDFNCQVKWLFDFILHSFV